MKSTMEIGRGRIDFEMNRSEKLGSLFFPQKNPRRMRPRGTAILAPFSSPSFATRRRLSSRSVPPLRGFHAVSPTQPASAAPFPSHAPPPPTLGGQEGAAGRQPSFFQPPSSTSTPSSYGTIAQVGNAACHALGTGANPNTLPHRLLRCCGAGWPPYEKKA